MVSYYKKIVVSENKFIQVFDNEFNQCQKLSFFNFVTSSKFMFRGSSVGINFELKLNGKQYLQSFFNEEELLDMKFIQSISTPFLKNFINQFQINRSYVFCSDHTIQHRFHIDPGDYTLLYFPNLEWDNSYGGETMFATDDLSEIVYTSLYTPGRIIVFNSDIFHKMSAPSSSCPFHRFTFVVNFSKIGD